MFAGPNGSGKSSLKSLLRPEWLGIYLNPDEIQRQIEVEGRLDFSTFDLEIEALVLLKYLSNATLLVQNKLELSVRRFVVESNVLSAPQGTFNAYHASVLCAYLRDKLLEQRRDFTIETVMSSPDKVDLLRRAKALGFRNYLYFIATESPAINISRVRYRVATGGHDVPESKIVSRYYRSLELVGSAIQSTDRAYLFDNSREDGANLWIAEVTDGVLVEGRSELVPAWFSKYVCQI